MIEFLRIAVMTGAGSERISVYTMSKSKMENIFFLIYY